MISASVLWAGVTISGADWSDEFTGVFSLIGAGAFCLYGLIIFKTLLDRKG